MAIQNHVYSPAKSVYAPWIRNHLHHRSRQSNHWKRTSLGIMILLYTLWKKSNRLLPSWIVLYLRQKYQSMIQQPLLQKYLPKTVTMRVPTNQILDYWFGQYDSIHECHVKLWMIPHQDAVHRQKVDDDIYTQFGIPYLTTLPTTVEPESWQDVMAYIILYDQMSRHVHRHLQTTSTKTTSGTGSGMLLSQEKCDIRAKQYSQLFLEKYKREINCGRIALPYIIFGIMPLRHSSSKNEYQYLLDSLLPQIHKTHLMDCTNLFQKFKTATQRRYTHLLDEYRHTTSTKNDGGDDYDILEHEHVPISTNVDNAMKHIVTRTIQSFFHTHNLLDGTVVISLSGGVDSMVIASVLSLLKQYDKHFESLQVVAVHLNYGNRPESTAEATYVEWYATQICNFDCKTCHIAQKYPHLIRTKIDRAEYETQTRQIRFDLYQSIHSNRGVLLGHHIGDVRENVISNIHRGSSLLELSGMTDVSVQNGTTILRPLLPLEKTSIFEYSHLFGVPYFKDTTPLWSTRGKLRTKLLPLLQDMYGPGSMNHLTNLAHQSDDFALLMKESFINPMTSTLIKYKMGLSLQLMPGKSVEVWKLVLKQLLHSHGLGMWTDKSVLSFHQRVFTGCGTTSTNKLGWLQCRKDYGVYVEPTTLQMYILYPSSFPWNTKQQYTYNNNDEKLEYDTVYQVGPWNIKLQRDENNKDNLLEKKAITSMNHFMMGTIIYYLPPSNAGYTFVSSYTKATRPSAWKHIDLRIQQTLPLVGSITPQQPQQNQTSHLTKVTMSLDPISTTTITTDEKVESNEKVEDTNNDNSMTAIETDKKVHETNQQVKENKTKNGKMKKDDSTIVKESYKSNTVKETSQDEKMDELATTEKNEDQKKKNEKTKVSPTNKEKEQMENLWESLIQPFVKRD